MYRILPVHFFHIHLHGLQ
nr:unnamed protein product [Callosobruchus chinensis]